MRNEIAQKAAHALEQHKKNTENFEERSVPKGFRLQKHIPSKYESLLSTLPFGSRKVSFTISDVSADDGFPRVVTPSSAGMS
jgi:hypothetical protein